jgi:hypothetical protein
MSWEASLKERIMFEFSKARMGYKRAVKLARNCLYPYTKVQIYLVL